MLAAKNDIDCLSYKIFHVEIRRLRGGPGLNLLPWLYCLISEKFSLQKRPVRRGVSWSQHTLQGLIMLSVPATNL